MKQSFILTILILAHGLVAQDQNLVIKKADVFKNGAAFITAEGALKFFNSEAVLTAVPQAVFGTLWMTSLEKQTRVSEIKSISRKNTATRKISSITELLKSNIGRKIIFNRSDDRKNAIQGTLQSVSGTDDRYIITIRNSQHTVAVTSYWYGGYFEFPEGLNDDYADTAETRVLSIRTNSKQANQNVRMHYFANQLAWAPSYIVDLTDDKNAQITLSATLINDAADLENVDLNFVVGFPNFIYKNVESPLSGTSALAGFMRQLYGSERQPSYQYQSALTNQMMTDYNEDASSEFTATEMSSLEGAAEEDLFFYALPGVTLKKTERGIYPVFSATVPYAHIYEVHLTNHLSRTKYNKDDNPKVWHSLKLENTTKHPWTTGSGMTTQNGRALGMDILKYTPKGSNGKLKITVSPDIHIADDEKEIERKQDNRKKYGYYYDLVKLEGEIRIRNYKEKPLTLVVTKSITGKILSAGTGSKIKPLPSANEAVNSDNVVEWEIQLKAGESRDIQYQYEVLMRH